MGLRSTYHCMMVILILKTLELKIRCSYNQYEKVDDVEIDQTDLIGRGLSDFYL